MGVLSAQRLLDSLSMAEWLEWQEYRKIRGPVGPDRWDFYVKRLIFAAGAPEWPEKKVPTMDDLRMPWEPEPLAATTKPSPSTYTDSEGRIRRNTIFVPPERRIRNSA